MPLTYPEVCKFLAESYEKTERQRRRWKNLNSDGKFNADDFYKDTKDNEADKQKVETENDISTPEYLASPKRHRHVKRELEVNRVFGILDMNSRIAAENDHGKPNLRPMADKTDPGIMRPVDPEHAKMIYKGSPCYSREDYLKTRSQMKPDEKYYYHQCSSWEYGWRLRDSYFGKHVAPTYGRNHLFTRDGMSRSGPQPDPYYYKWPKIKPQRESTKIQYYAS